MDSTYIYEWAGSSLQCYYGYCLFDIQVQYEYILHIDKYQSIPPRLVIEHTYQVRQIIAILIHRCCRATTITVTQ